jgi:hypothetical protein
LPTFARSTRDSPSTDYGWAIFATDSYGGIYVDGAVHL